MAEKPATADVVELKVHDMDDRARIEARVRDGRFDSWDAVVSAVESHGISVCEIERNLRAADPAFGGTALSGFIWGIALALRAKANDPYSAASWIARGLGDFTLPDSPAHADRFAEGYGKFASMLLRRWSLVMAIVAGRIPDGFVEPLSRIAKQAGQFRGQTWQILVLCKGEGPPDCLGAADGYLHADVEFSREPGWLRVSRSTAVHRPVDSPPVVYVATTVEEGVAILDFESANLCIALSEPEAVMFAHPVVGAYARQSRGTSRLVRTVAMEMPKFGTRCSELMSRVSGYMVNMYADLHVHGIGLDAGEMENTGFPEISGVGAVETLMAVACQTAASLPRWLGA